MYSWTYRGPIFMDGGPNFMDRGPVFMDRGPNFMDRGPVFMDRGPTFMDRVHAPYRGSGPPDPGTGAEKTLSFERKVCLFVWEVKLHRKH